MKRALMLAVVILAMAHLAVGADITLLDTNGFEAYSTGSIGGQDGWNGNATIYNGSLSEMWINVYKDSQGNQLSNMPGLAVAATAHEARHSFPEGGGKSSTYQISYSMYLGTFAAGNTCLDFQLEMIDGGVRTFPVTVRVTNVGNGSNFKVQALDANVSGAISRTLYDSQVDDEALFSSTAKTRLDLQLTVDLLTDTYSLSISEWTPTAWIAGTPLRVLQADGLDVTGPDTVPLYGVRFIGRNSGSAWTMYDNVVATVPEPMTMILMVGGACLAGRNRRR